MLAKKAIKEHSDNEKGTFVSSENALDALPAILKQNFHLTVPEGFNPSSKKSSTGSSIMDRMKESHMNKINFATSEDVNAAESVYGSYFTQLQGLEKSLP